MIKTPLRRAVVGGMLLPPVRIENSLGRVIGDTTPIGIARAPRRMRNSERIILLERRSLGRERREAEDSFANLDAAGSAGASG